LIDWIFPFRERETLSRISGISEAIGAKKKASNIGFTLHFVEIETTDLFKPKE